MKKTRSVQSTVIPEGWEPAPDERKLIFWFKPFIKWLQYVNTNQCLK